MASIHEVFERRLQRHIDLAADGLIEAQRNVMAKFAYDKMLASGARLKRQAQVRNEAVADIVEWCLVEVAAFSKEHGMRQESHGNQVRPALERFMRASREKLTFEGFGPAAANEIAKILDKADAHRMAELDEFAVGAWRPRSQGGNVTTNNSVTLNHSQAVIQQAGDGAHQTAQGVYFDGGSLREALDAFAKATADAELAGDVREAIATEIETLRPQLRKDKPSAVIVRESMSTLRNIVEGVASGALTPAFTALITAALPLIGGS